MLLHCAWADVQLLRDFLVATTLDEQLQNLFVARCNLDFVQIRHNSFSTDPGFADLFRSATSLKARVSPNFRPQMMPPKLQGSTVLRGQTHKLQGASAGDELQ